MLPESTVVKEMDHLKMVVQGRRYIERVQVKGTV